MLFPQPQKLFPAASASPNSPGEDPSLHSPGYIQDRSDLGTGPLGDSETLKATHGSAHRPLSAISTCAGATPGPEGRTSPQQWSPLRDNVAADAGDNADPRNNALVNGQQRRGARSGATGLYKAPTWNSFEGAVPPSVQQGAPRQTGKVFVGGVPQELTQDELYNLFKEFGPVKKAWLQSFRAPVRTGHQAAHNHRGFGFVIFYDSQTVDKILGPCPANGQDSQSRFIPLPDNSGRKVEIKRALPSNELPPPPNGPVPQGSPVQHPSGKAPSASPMVARQAERVTPGSQGPKPQMAVNPMTAQAHQGTVACLGGLVGAAPVRYPMPSGHVAMQGSYAAAPWQHYASPVPQAQMPQAQWPAGVDPRTPIATWQQQQQPYMQPTSVTAGHPQVQAAPVGMHPHQQQQQQPMPTAGGCMCSGFMPAMPYPYNPGAQVMQHHMPHMQAIPHQHPQPMQGYQAANVPMMVGTMQPPQQQQLLQQQQQQLQQQQQPPQQQQQQ